MTTDKQEAPASTKPSRAMEELFDTSPPLIEKADQACDFYFKLEQLIPWSESEMIKANIQLDEVEDIASVYGFSQRRVRKLILAKKYNKLYNPSIDCDWVRLTKVFMK